MGVNTPLKRLKLKYKIEDKKEERKTKMDIRKHRFIPQIQTFSKVITDKKKKMNSRSNLKKRLRDEGF
jgi:hypothetical protein